MAKANRFIFFSSFFFVHQTSVESIANRIIFFSSRASCSRPEVEFSFMRKLEKHVRSVLSPIEFSAHFLFLSRALTFNRKRRSQEEPQTGAEAELPHQSDLHDGVWPRGVSGDRVRQGLCRRLSGNEENFQSLDFPRETKL